MRIQLFLAAAAALLLASGANAQPTVQELCSRATMTAAASGTITAETIRYGGTDRFFCTYTPSTSTTAPSTRWSSRCTAAAATPRR